MNHACWKCLIVCCFFGLVFAKNQGKSINGKKVNSQAQPNVIEIDLATQNTLKEVSISYDGKNSPAHTISNRVPTKTFCGLQHTDDRVYTDSATALDEFPWLVDIVHQDNISICPGVLISNHFVLTGYGCGLFSYKVRLGLYHTKQEVSCVLGAELPECSKPVIEIKVEKEMYTNAKGEMALLQLADSIEYTDFIRPICLPLDESSRPMHGNEVVASGWGQNVEDGNGSSKKRLLFKLKTPEQCQAIDSNFGISENEFCIMSEEKRNDVGCIDDYGGPIMYTHKHQWYVEGILVGPYTRNRTYGYCSESIKPIYDSMYSSET